MVSLMAKTKIMIVDNIFLGFQKSGTKSRGVIHFVLLRRFYDVLFVPLFCGTKSRGVLHFVPLRRFYDVLFVPLFCRPRENCGRLWRTMWLHNVDNIRQKDIKTIVWSLDPMDLKSLVQKETHDCNSTANKVLRLSPKLSLRLPSLGIFTIGRPVGRFPMGHSTDTVSAA